MKRGFLKSKAPPSRTDAASQSEAPRVAKPVTKPLAIAIPVAPPQDPDVPRVGRVPAQTSNCIITTLTNGNTPTVCLFYPDTKEAVIELLKNSGPHPELDLLVTMPNIKAIPGQGRGMFTTKAVKAGDHILAERPMLVSPEAVPVMPSSPADLLELMIGKLPAVSRAAFYKLHNCKTSDPRDIRGIIDTNALAIGRLPGPYDGMHAGIVYSVSFFNHSCTPNAEHHWDMKNFGFYVTALRPIAAGEQIYISYCGDPFSSRAERQEDLSSKYSFTCACASCKLPKDLSSRSDVRRKIIGSRKQALLQEHKKHEDTLTAWATDPSLPDDHILKPIRFVMQLMEEEQAFDIVLWLSLAEIACKALCALGDRAGVVELAQKAAAYTKTRKYCDDAGWGKVAAAPEHTKWWGKRKKTVE